MILILIRLVMCGSLCRKKKERNTVHEKAPHLALSVRIEVLSRPRKGRRRFNPDRMVLPPETLAGYQQQCYRLRSLGTASLRDFWVFWPDASIHDCLWRDP